MLEVARSISGIDTWYSGRRGGGGELGRLGEGEARDRQVSINRKQC